MIKPNFNKIMELDLRAVNPRLPDAIIIKKIEQRAKSLIKKFEKQENNRQLINPIIDDLLINFGLSEFRDDFLFMAHYYSQEVVNSRLKKNVSIRFSNYQIELHKALIFLRDNKPVELSIKSKRETKSVKIVCQDLIWYIKDQMIDALISTNFPLNNHDELKKNWEKIIDTVCIKEKERASRAGRKVGNLSVLKVVYVLHSYLQKYTKLKANNTPSGFSDEQGRFIYDFLEKAGITEKKNIKEPEESIRHKFNYWKGKILNN